MDKKGRLYFRLILVASVLALAALSYIVLAENPEGTPRIITDTNASTANVTSTFATNHKTQKVII